MQVMNQKGPRLSPEGRHMKNSSNVGSTGRKLDELSPILKIAFNPRQSSVPNTIHSVAQYFIINGIIDLLVTVAAKNFSDSDILALIVHP